jgi:hypothetical protein
VKEAALGIAIGGAALALALGFATAKLHTELARAPVLTQGDAQRRGDWLARGRRRTSRRAHAADLARDYHFHRMTQYGLPANLIVTPIVSLLIMPIALLVLLAMPFGLEVWPLKAMGFGIELMVRTGHSGWPHGPAQSRCSPRFRDRRWY